jgi:hypothetical protein
MTLWCVSHRVLEGRVPEEVTNHVDDRSLIQQMDLFVSSFAHNQLFCVPVRPMREFVNIN